jgi:hypothetical protein
MLPGPKPETVRIFPVILAFSLGLSESPQTENIVSQEKGPGEIPCPVETKVRRGRLSRRNDFRFLLFLRAFGGVNLFRGLDCRCNLVGIQNRVAIKETVAL